MAFKYFIKRIWPFAVFFCLTGAAEFIYKLISCKEGLDMSVFTLMKMAANFIAQSSVVFGYEIFIVAAYLFILPRRLHGEKIDRVLSGAIFFITAYITLFAKIAEALFWNEFGVSFNFIAVDYLVYTQEMLGNIIETYPVGTLLSIILIVTIAFSYLNNRLIKRESFILPLVPNLWGRLKCAASIFLCLAAAYFVLDGAQAANISPNRYNQEIAKNETYSFFNAFLANKLDYGEFYITRDDAANIKDLQEIYRAANVTYKENDTLKRFIKADGAEKRKNVVLVIMESMSSSFMNENNPEGENLTPNLTRLAEEGLYFANVYATGTRTVRGLEAATLSMPPQTGMSIIRQKGNENLQNIGTLFKERGYDVSWIYGGYGYFDNMNDFFRNNGFSVTDRTDISADKIHHETTWGVADEDLFTKAIESADQSAANGSSFFQLILTTSNHSPYTYPDGRIDIEAGTRKGAVKYADWAVGDFVARAKEKPWFNDTIFVFLGDHGAASAGKKELNPSTHKVVSVIYSPSEIAPQRIDKTISQIDVMPTVLGLLNFSYEASFMGRDALAAPDDGRYFISNYQYVGYGEKDRLLILKPVRESVYYNGDNEENENNKEDAPDETMLNRAVAYYQYAAKWQEILR